MKKKSVLFLLLSFCLAGLLAIPAAADTGPKPSITVDIAMAEETPCYATLLAQEESTGPWSKQATFDESFCSPDTDQAIWTIFNNYPDADGYHFLGYFEDCTDSRQLSWTYYPPQVFKVLLYFPETDTFAVSEDSYEPFAFHSFFTAAVSPDDGTVRVSAHYPWKTEALSLATRVFITLAVELAIALPFGLRSRRQLLFITGVNIMTQGILNLLLNLMGFQFGEMVRLLNYFWMELLVFVVEGICYAKALPRRAKDPQKVIHPWRYALTANLASFLLGFILSLFIPNIF